MTQKECAFETLHIRPEDVYVEMGYGGALPDEQVVREVAWALEDVAKVTRPRFCYRVVQGLLEDAHPHLLIGEACLEVGNVIARQLRGSEAFALFVATAGDEYDEWCKRQDDVLRAFVVSSIGSVVVERCADLMEKTLQAGIDKLGWHHTNRFSPGYCGWDVKGQHQLFSLLSPSPCGVTLTDGAMMHPVKSVSGVVGVGPKVRRHPYSCGLCNMENCYKRNIVRR